MFYSPTNCITQLRRNTTTAAGPMASLCISRGRAHNCYLDFCQETPPSNRTSATNHNTSYSEEEPLHHLQASVPDTPLHSDRKCMTYGPPAELCPSCVYNIHQKVASAWLNILQWLCAVLFALVFVVTALASLQLYCTCIISPTLYMYMLCGSNTWLIRCRYTFLHKCTCVEWVVDWKTQNKTKKQRHWNLKQTRKQIFIAFFTQQFVIKSSKHKLLERANKCLYKSQQ